MFEYSSEGLRLFDTEYPRDERSDFHQRTWVLADHIYILGSAQRLNYRTDLLFMRLDAAGQVEVRKKIGYYSLNDYYGDSYIDGDGNFIVLGTRASDDYIVDEKKIKGWAKPFIMKLDTAGNILDQWFGEENDPRVLFGKRFFMTPDSGHVIIGKDYKEVPHVIGTIVYSSPTICKLDKDHNLLWKHTLSDFKTTQEYLADLAFDPLTETYVTAGMLGVPFGENIDDRILVMKFDDAGNIIWSFLETLSEPPSGLHDVGGVVVSATGSIYVTGRQYRPFEEPPRISWLMKVTADGCIDTLCTTTSIEEQIAAREGWQVVFPNPVRDEIRIIMPEADPLPMTMAVFDLQGRIVDRIQVTERQQSFNVDWQPGMYGYQLLHKGVPKYVGKLVKME
jgi:hypothetical protein